MKKFLLAAIVFFLVPGFGASAQNLPGLDINPCPDAVINESLWHVAYTVSSLSPRIDSGVYLCKVTGLPPIIRMDIYSVATDIAYQDVSYPFPGDAVTNWAYIDDLDSSVKIVPMNGRVLMPGAGWVSYNVPWRLEDSTGGYKGRLKLISTEQDISFLVLPNGTVALVDPSRG